MISGYLNVFMILIIIECLIILSARSLITSILLLISTFIKVSLIYLILGAEFMAVSIIIVYVGAISILFLFVIMMMNLRVSILYRNYYSYSPIIVFLVSFLIFTVFIIYGNCHISFSDSYIYMHENGLDFGKNSSNANLLGVVLYNHYYYIVVVCGLILLLSLISSITLTIDYEYHLYKIPINNRYCDTHILKKNINFIAYY